MELIITILIYLGTLLPGNSYTAEEIHQYEIIHQQEIEIILEDEALSTQIYNKHISDFQVVETKGLIEYVIDEEYIYD